MPGVFRDEALVRRHRSLASDLLERHQLHMATVLAIASIGLSPGERIAGAFFDWFTKSAGVNDLHREHVKSDTVQHMMKSVPWLAGAPDENKLQFARGSAGEAVSEFMRLEQRYIGDWKVERIVEAAGPEFDASSMRKSLLDTVSSSPVVVFSFVDCPWCLLAKERLRAMEGNAQFLPKGSVRVVELEELGREGKAIRAAIALATRRTSMPSIFVGGRCIGGFTDGDPVGDPELCHEGAPGLEQLTEGDGDEFGRLLSAL